MTPTAILAVSAKMRSLAWASVEANWKASDATGHRIDVTLGADRRRCPHPHYPGWRTWRAEVAARMKPTRRRLNIMSALATGWLPWGVDWRTGDQERGGSPEGHGRNQRRGQALARANRG